MSDTAQKDRLVPISLPHGSELRGKGVHHLPIPVEHIEDAQQYYPLHVGCLLLKLWWACQVLQET